MFWAWLGNIRELQNSVERAVSMAEAPIIDVLDLPPDLFDAAVRGKTGVILNGPDRSLNYCPHEGGATSKETDLMLFDDPEDQVHSTPRRAWRCPQRTQRAAFQDYSKKKDPPWRRAQMGRVSYLTVSTGRSVCDRSHIAGETGLPAALAAGAAPGGRAADHDAGSVASSEDREVYPRREPPMSPDAISRLRRRMIEDMTIRQFGAQQHPVGPRGARSRSTRI
jgi:hypothetical protein